LTEYAASLIKESQINVDKRQEPSLRILDLCTGSGCIALLLQHRLQQARIQAEITAVDNSKAALELANQNFSRVASNGNPVDSLVTTTIKQMDIFDNQQVHQLLLERGPFDVIVSNPPYIPTREWETLDESVRHWEDAEALIGDVDGINDGLAFYRRIANLAANTNLLAHRYKDMPSLIVEVGHNQAKHVKDIFIATSIFQKTAIWDDPWHIQRGVLAWTK
jgi:release factor glutamine methyltransferase